MSSTWQTVRSRLSLAYLLGDSPVASWLRGAGWVFSSSMVERVVALGQTVLIARSIGMNEYGHYALLFASISLLSPIASLQLPFAIVVFVSRYAERDPGRAGAVVILGERLTLLTGGAIVLTCALFPGPVSMWLYGSAGYGFTAFFGALVLLLSTQAGLYDSVLQAREEFRILAIARTVTALFTLGLLLTAMHYDSTLRGVLIALVAGAVVRALSVAVPARKLVRALTARSSVAEARRQLPIIIQFSLPSGALSLLMSYATWIGSYILSRQQTGFRDLAIINTAVQWRGPILIIMTALSSALLPMLGRTMETEGLPRAGRLQTLNMTLNMGISIIFCIVAIVAADPILGLYGPGFRGQGHLFGLFLIALVPTVYCNVHQQYLVAAGRMWSQLLVYVPFGIINLAGALWFGENLNGSTLGYIQLAAWLATAAIMTLIIRARSLSIPPLESAEDR
ncbi:MAG: oligosaccharide flippase family protein [Sphingomonas bacterium]